MEDNNKNLINITPELLNQYKEWFNHYGNSFKELSDSQKQNFQLKLDHTYRVCENIVDIGSSIGLNDYELILAEIIALFHDLGRFEQIRKYNTFSDSLSMDHGDYGVEVLKEKDLLHDIDENSKNIIYKSINYHNKFQIPKNGTQEILKYIMLIRDADKVDVFEVLLPYYQREKVVDRETVTFNLAPSPDISPIVLEKMFQGKMINKKYLKTVSDFKILQIAWVYDINYLRAFEIIREKKYIEKILDTLPASKEKEKITRKILNYINCKITEKKYF